MKIIRKIIFVLSLCLISTFLMSCVKIVKTGEEDKLIGNVVFDAKANVSESWDTVFLPELLNKAIDMSDLYVKANGDFANVSDLGIYTMGDKGELNFTVKDSATVKENESEKKAGYLVINIDSIPNEQTIKLQVGPLFRGTSVRDNLQSINFDDYVNQIEWGGVSHSLNDKIYETVINDSILNLKSGDKIDFCGCFTVSPTGEILITPISIEVK